MRIIWILCLTLSQWQCIWPHSLVDYSAQPMAVITAGSMNPAGRTMQSNADYSRKVSVRVSDTLTRQRAAESATFRPSLSAESESEEIRRKASLLPMAHIVVRPQQHAPPSNALVVPVASTHNVIHEDRSWPPEHSQEFGRVGVRVMGQKLDTSALSRLTPSSDAAAIKKLRKILGRELQPDWMSVDAPPKESSKSTRSLAASEIPQPDKSLLQAVEKLNFTILRPAPNSDVPVPVEFTSEQIGLFRDWLVQRATCRMEFVWEDLGSLFWPRWIKHGICVNSAACSWPPGMRCRPSSSRALKLLRWTCSDNAKQPREAQKRWLYNEADQMRRRARRDGLSGGARRRIAREERRTKRVRRLIRRLSLTANGYRCEWNPHEFMVTDQCSCGCE